MWTDWQLSSQRYFMSVFRTAMLAMVHWTFGLTLVGIASDWHQFMKDPESHG